MGAHDLCIDPLPELDAETKAAALRLVNRQPEAALLRSILGLEPVPVALVRNPKWCDKHEREKRPKPGGGWRCGPCETELNRARRKRIAEADPELWERMRRRDAELKRRKRAEAAKLEAAP